MGTGRGWDVETGGSGYRGGGFRPSVSEYTISPAITVLRIVANHLPISTSFLMKYSWSLV